MRLTTSVIETRLVMPGHDGAPAHVAILDGWRGMSILIVLAAHMLPLGPVWLKLNEAAGFLGMSLFFILSGALITTSLLRDAAPIPFLIKRVFRIVPLAWLFVGVVLVWHGAPIRVIAANLLFYANSAEDLLYYAPHLWSLSVEMQFYVFVAALVAVGGRRALWLLPVLGILVTAARVFRGQLAGVETLDRVDEILAGAMLALALARAWRPPAWIATPFVIGLLLLAIMVGCQGDVRSAMPAFAYLRPYCAAGAIGLSLFMPPGWLTRVLSGRPLRYVASISYALYVIHPLTYTGWLGAGDKIERYLKRPFCFILAFGAAHLSTTYFERRFNSLGRRLASRYRPNRPRVAEPLS